MSSKSNPRSLAEEYDGKYRDEIDAHIIALEKHFLAGFKAALSCPETMELVELFSSIYERQNCVCKLSVYVDRPVPCETCQMCEKLIAFRKLESEK